MSEIDPLCGYQEGGQAAPTYAHYSRIKKGSIGARNCKIAIAGLVVILIALVVAVVLLFVYDKPLVVAPDNELLDAGGLLRMAQGDKYYSRLREDDVSAESIDGDPFSGQTGHPLVVSTRNEKSRYNEDPSLYNQFSRFNKEFGESRHYEAPPSAKKAIKARSKASLEANDAVIIRDCLKKGWDQVAQRKALEKTLTPPEGPAFYQQMATALIAEAADEMDAAVATEATLKCLKEQNVDLERLKHRNPDWSGLRSELPQCRQQPVSCNAKYKYRSLEGTCNNLRQPKRGSKLQPFRRLLPADYVDGLSEPKASFPNGIYPPARQVSICMQNATNEYSELRLNLLFAHFAHFLDHDMVSIAAYKGENRSAIPCCDQSARHPECYSLELKDNDPFYRDVGLMCMDFVRSAPAPVCSIGAREQTNQQTAYIDLSNVYSVNEFEGRKILRDIAGGYLRSPTEADGRYMLLRNMDPNDGCNTPDMLAANTPCFKSGDSRVNTFIGLTAMTQAWMREHNRVTDFLMKINPHWDDERLYQESRRIVIAEMQHIVYNEFLPILFGEKMTKQLNIRPLKEGYYYGYDADVDAGVSNSFASAAFRFYHSMYRGHVGFNDPEGSTGYREKEGTWYYVLTHTMLFKPNILWNFGTVDALWRGAAATHARPMHNSFAHDNANHLFETGNDTYGFDIFAFDIQRGRDHGIPPYYKWREFCNLPPASNFTQMQQFFRPHSLEVIQRFYVDGTHLDLFTGMLAENPIEDGILGPVSACIIGDQFVRAKNGDRFWYETPDPMLRFTPAQLETIRNITLARVLCENGDNLDMIPGRAMEAISEANPLLHCSGYQIHRLDLTRWDEPEPVSSKKH